MSDGNHTSATYIINLMEPDERDRTGHRFDPYDDTMESIASKVRISATLELDVLVKVEFHSAAAQVTLDMDPY